jgi:hypothetical protein
MLAALLLLLFAMAVPTKRAHSDGRKLTLPLPKLSVGGGTAWRGAKEIDGLNPYQWLGAKAEVNLTPRVSLQGEAVQNFLKDKTKAQDYKVGLWVAF